MSLFDLTGRVAIVTGGNGGIGLGIAAALAEAGASVAIAGRNAEKSAEARATLEARGSARAGGVLCVDVDVTDSASVTRMVDATVERFGRLDVLVANAGVNLRKPPEEHTDAEFSTIIHVNVNGPFYCARAAHAVMKRGGGGKIITIGSMASIFGAPFAAAYTASKGAVVQLTRALATAWAKDNIQVNAILPGYVDTDLTRKAREVLPGLNEKVLARTPQQRWGTPRDFAGIAVFLASGASDFVTGAAIPVDGGFSAQIL